LGVERDKRRRVQGVINYSSTDGEKNIFGAERGEKMKGGE